ncbi:hypothetical protein D3C78_620770 [compost metagenome]
MQGNAHQHRQDAVDVHKVNQTHSPFLPSLTESVEHLTKHHARHAFVPKHVHFPDWFQGAKYGWHVHIKLDHLLLLQMQANESQPVHAAVIYV